jgi:hypothetical protein
MGSFQIRSAHWPWPAGVADTNYGKRHLNYAKIKFENESGHTRTLNSKNRYENSDHGESQTDEETADEETTDEETADGQTTDEETAESSDSRISDTPGGHDAAGATKSRFRGSYLERVAHPSILS